MELRRLDDALTMTRVLSRNNEEEMCHQSSWNFFVCGGVADDESSQFSAIVKSGFLLGSEFGVSSPPPGILKIWFC